jgi:hypothetical protein
MIVVTVELLPGGDASRRETIASAEIANVSGLAASSNYECVVTSKGETSLGIEPTSSKFRVCGHHRQDGVLPLLRRVFRRADASAKREEAAQ